MNASARGRTAPKAPPVYRPGHKQVLQPKMALQERGTPAAPPAYRPEPRHPSAAPTQGARASVQAKLSGPRTPGTPLSASSARMTNAPRGAQDAARPSPGRVLQPALGGAFRAPAQPPRAVPNPLNRNAGAWAKSPRGAIQLMTIDVNGKPVHINEYHFIHLMHKVDSIGLSNKKHTVILDNSYNIPTLRLAAQESRGKDFAHEGYSWTWNGEGELVPSDGPNVVNLSGQEIEALRSFAKLDVTPPANLTKQKEFQLAYRALGEITGSRNKIQESSNKKQASSDEDSLQIPFIPTLLPRETVRYAPGDKPNQGFLMGPNGSKQEHPHIHLFFEPTASYSSSNSNSSGKKKSKKHNIKDEAESSPTEVLSIRSAVATLGPTAESGKDKRHLRIDRDGKIILNSKLGSRNDDEVTIKELEKAFAAITTGVYKEVESKTPIIHDNKKNNSNNSNNNTSPTTSSSSSTAAVQVGPPEPKKKANAIVLQNVADAVGMTYVDLLRALEAEEMDPDDAEDHGEANLICAFRPSK